MSGLQRQNRRCRSKGVVWMAVLLSSCLGHLRPAAVADTGTSGKATSGKATSGKTTTAQETSGHHAAELEPLVRLLLDVDDNAFRIDVLRGMEDALRGRKNVPVPPSWAKVSRKLSVSSDAELRRRCLRLSLIFREPQVIAGLRKQMLDAQQPLAKRNAALELLVQNNVEGLGDDLQRLVSDQGLRRSAIRGLANYPGDQVAQIILGQYGELSAAGRRDAVATLASNIRNARALLQSVTDGRVSPRDLSAFVARQIETLGDAALTARLKSVWGSVRPTTQDRRRLIADYKRRLTPESLTKANLSRGRLLFSKQCASCHQLFDAGQRIGPNLTGSQRNNLDYVLENLLDPSAVVGRDFQMTVVLTVQGRVVSGIVVREDGKTLTLQTPTDRVIIPFDDIEQRRRQKLSLMPDGMLQKMSDEQVRDLVGYLASPRQVKLPMQTESNAPPSR